MYQSILKGSSAVGTGTASWLFASKQPHFSGASENVVFIRCKTKKQPLSKNKETNINLTQQCESKLTKYTDETLYRKICLLQ